jgi:subtilase family serine protease
MRFRWLDAAGAVLRATRASSRSCAIPDPRADLRVSGLEVRLGDDGGTNRYAVTVRNAGRRRADASDLRLTLPGQPLLTGLIGGLAPGQKEVLVLTGPACAPGETITATADAGDAIDESDELNDRAFVCPAAPSARAKR